jgi:hypothetical protein
LSEHLEHLSDPVAEKNPIPHDTHFIPGMHVMACSRYLLILQFILKTLLTILQNLCHM